MVIPDVSINCNIRDRKNVSFTGLPRFVMEVLSDSTEEYDRNEKMQIYCKVGVSEYWIVDWRKKQVEIYPTLSAQVIFRQFLNSGTSYDAITSHMVIAAIRYLILAVERFKNSDNRSIRRMLKSEDIYYDLGVAKKLNNILKFSKIPLRNVLLVTQRNEVK